jgi:hypothetical protein
MRQSPPESADRQHRLGLPRQHGLGHYCASRETWSVAYRSARLRKHHGLDVDAHDCGIWWKAQLIVYYERAGPHRETGSSASRLVLNKLTDEILGEIKDLEAR